MRGMCVFLYSPLAPRRHLEKVMLSCDNLYVHHISTARESLMYEDIIYINKCMYKPYPCIIPTIRHSEWLD